jgi:hypothetical protein
MMQINKYQNACVLSNIGSALMERGLFQEAHDTLHTAVAVFQRAFQPLHSTDDDTLFEETRRNAEVALRQDALRHTMCYVEVILPDQNQMPSSIFDLRIIESRSYFSAHPMIVNQASRSPSSLDVDFHCAAVIYNFALAKLCLSALQNDEKLVSCGIQLLKMAFNQLRRIICAKEEDSTEQSINASANQMVLCALVLSNLARALRLVSAHGEAQEMLEKLSMIEANLCPQEQEDHNGLFQPTAAPAA